MEAVYFIPSVPTFIPAAWRKDGTYNEDTFPKDAVLLEDSVAQEYWKATPPPGKTLGASPEGQPIWIDIPVIPLTPDEIAEQLRQRKASVRAERDNLLRTVYDSGTQMIRRELETEPLDPVYATKLLAKRTELHAYARLLQAVPEQAGFPDSVVWPEQPSEELE